MRVLISLSLIFLCISYIRGYEMGPPLAVCKTMFPGHNVESQDTSSPYTITVNATVYAPNDIIEVRVNSTGAHGITFFEGLMIQARRINCKHNQYDIGVGSFSLINEDFFLDLMNCNGNTASSVVHKNHSHIHDRVFHWRAPSSSSGHLRIQGTIVRRHITFWTNVQSSIIYDPLSNEDTTVCSRGNPGPTFSAIIMIVFSVSFFFFH